MGGSNTFAPDSRLLLNWHYDIQIQYYLNQTALIKGINTILFLSGSHM